MAKLPPLMIRSLRTFRSAFAGLLLAAVGCLSLAGCKQYDPGFDDPFAKDAHQLRPKKTSSTRKLGLSARSQEIEDDLGVQ